jgi:hypothetical protein
MRAFHSRYVLDVDPALLRALLVARDAPAHVDDRRRATALTPRADAEPLLLLLPTV